MGRLITGVSLRLRRWKRATECKIGVFQQDRYPAVSAYPAGYQLSVSTQPD